MKRDDDQDDDGAQIAEGNVDASAHVTASALEFRKIKNSTDWQADWFHFWRCRGRLRVPFRRFA
jgi:hypothetical protein